MTLSFINNAIGLIIKKLIQPSLGKNNYINWWKLRSLIKNNGQLSIGNNSIIKCRIDFDRKEGKVTIGNHCYLGNSHLVCHTGINIGNDVIISWGVTIVDHDSHSLEWKNRQHDVIDWACKKKDWTNVNIAPVHIKNKVWIGFGASILKGVTIEEECVVAANSVVTKSFPPRTLIGGNPAKIIRYLDSENTNSNG